MTNETDEGCLLLAALGFVIFIACKWLERFFESALCYFRTDPTGKTIANIYHIGEYVVVVVLLCYGVSCLWHHIARNGRYSLIVTPPPSLARESAAMEKYVNIYFIIFMVVAFLCKYFA